MEVELARSPSLQEIHPHVQDTPDWMDRQCGRSLLGDYGAVTDQAQEVHCSRQSVYDHAQKVYAAVAAEHSGGPSREQLIQENQAVREENTQLWNWLSLTIEFPLVKQHKVSAVALGMGLSLTQIAVLLALLLGAKAAPARSTVHRGDQAAGVAAGKVLTRLDAQCKALVLVGCLDEIFFHGRAVLVGVEPASMVWFLGRRPATRGSRSGPSNCGLGTACNT